MSTVTRRINQFKDWPDFKFRHILKVNYMMIAKSLLATDNKYSSVTPQVIGVTIDHLSRFIIWNKPVIEAFKESLYGIRYWIEQEGSINYQEFYSNIFGLGRTSVSNAVLLSKFIQIYRNADYEYPILKEVIKQDINNLQNNKTIINDSIYLSITSMIKNMKQYFDKLNIKNSWPGFKFDINTSNKYSLKSKYISKGDLDLILDDGIWDLKVSKTEPAMKDIRQVLVYFLLARRSKQFINHQFKTINIINPRLSKVYSINIKDIPSEILVFFDENVIGFNESYNQFFNNNK